MRGTRCLPSLSEPREVDHGLGSKLATAGMSRSKPRLMLVARSDELPKEVRQVLAFSEAGS